MQLFDDYTVVGLSAASFDTITNLPGGIPQTYKHLKLIVSGKCDQVAFQNLIMTINNDNSAFYYSERANVKGAGVLEANESVAGTTGQLGLMARSGGLASGVEATIMDYRGTIMVAKSWTSSFTMVDDNATARIYTGSAGGVYSPSVAAAITRLRISLGSGLFLIGSRFTLYGLN